MSGAHVVATVLSAVVLLLGERALWALLERVLLLLAIPGRWPAQLRLTLSSVDDALGQRLVRGVRKRWFLRYGT